VLPASLSSPPGSRCVLCDQASPAASDARRESRRRWSRRAF
jgi:hypothetical protein